VGISVQVSFDATDAPRLAQFWAVALDYVVQPPPEGFDTWEDWARSAGIPEELWPNYSAVVDPAGTGPRLFFQKVPEGKTAKNRMHLDVNVGAGAADDTELRQRVDAHVERLVAAGGTVVATKEEQGQRWVVMQDPEGNELCVQ
jgi:Glyoxalase-like domain